MVLGSWSRCPRWYRRLWLGCSVPFGVLGAATIVSGSHGVRAVVFLGVIAASALVCAGCRGGRSPVARWWLRLGVMSAAAAAATTGLAALAGNAAGLVLLLAAVTNPLLVGALTSWSARSRGPEPRTPAPAVPRVAPGVPTSTATSAGSSVATQTPVRQVVPQAAPIASPPGWVVTSSTEELCLVWRRSFLVLLRVQQHGTVTSQATIVALRQTCLDEMARRHPVGFARWLSHGARPASDPSRYLR